MIEENKRSREHAAEQAQSIVAEGAVKWEKEHRASQSVDLIRQYRDQATDLRDRELEKAIKLLQSGSVPEEVLAQLAKNLTNKLIHRPTVQLGQASGEGRDDLLAWSKELLGLDDEGSTN